MFKLSVKSEFSAAHNLRGYKGKCESLHGHNWKVEAVVVSEALDNIGMVLDFHKIKSALKNILDELDHKYINDIEYFKRENPTSENIARYVFNKLKSKFNKESRWLKEVIIWESDNCSAGYSE